MHTVGVNLIANQDMDFNGIEVNVHHIKSIHVEDSTILNICLEGSIVLAELERYEDFSYSYIKDTRILRELKEFGHSWILDK